MTRKNQPLCSHLNSPLSCGEKEPTIAQAAWQFQFTSLLAGEENIETANTEIEAAVSQFTPFCEGGNGYHKDRVGRACDVSIHIPIV